MKGSGASKNASEEYKRGLWTVEEDNILMDYIEVHGKGKWNRVAKVTGLKRCGKSCRLRWKNYLSPDVKRGNFSEEEDDLIIRLHKLLGNRWSLIAGRVPGRTDNQVKNHWNTHLRKKLGVKNEIKCKVSPNHSTDDKTTSQNVADHGGSQDASIEIDSAKGLQSMDDFDWDHYSFLFPNDEYPNFYTSNLMEFGDVSLDFLCDF